MAVVLYEHNLQTYQTMKSMFDINNRVGIVQPTGTGKSFIYLKWIEDNCNDSFVLFSPSIEIFTQLKEYAEASDELELLDSVQMITYQTLLYMAQEEVDSINPDKIILDEFHRTGADLWGPAVQNLLRTYPDAKVLGATATPVRYLDDAKDMASELFDGNLAVEMTLGEAVQREILPTPKYIPVWYDIDGKLEQYEKDIAGITDPKERKELENKLYQMKRNLETSYGAEDIFKKHLPNNHGKFIVFCRNKEHLQEMIQAMNKWLSCVNTNINSYISISVQEDKDIQLKAFKEDNSNNAIKLLFTIDRLNEGLHVKGIDGVIMLRPTTSPIIYLQQMGRALAVGNKEPLIFDMVNNYMSVQIPLANGNTVNVFEKEFKDSRLHNNNNKVISPFKIFDEMIEFSRIFKELESVLYISRDDAWDKNFELLKEFFNQYNRFPKSREIYHGVNIGQWCRIQKYESKKTNYPQERIDKLKSIGFNLSPNTSKEWNYYFDLTKSFKNEYGRLPYQREIYKNEKIGIWCDTNKRRALKEGYPEDRKEKLKGIGVFDKNREMIQSEQWEYKFYILNQFIEINGRVPKKFETYQDVNIGYWYDRQKKLAKTANYPDEHRKKFESIGIQFRIMTKHENKKPTSYNVRWENNYNLLARFVKEFNRFPKSEEIYKNIRIGEWCYKQKYHSRKVDYPKDRREKLEQIGLI